VTDEHPGCRPLQKVVLPTDRSLLPLYVEGHEPAGAVLGRSAYRVPAGQRVSFDAYFSAFPASYWQRWTEVREVELTVVVSAAATVSLWRSDGAGRPARVRQHIAPQATAVRFPVALVGFDDGGWLWFEVEAGPDDVEIGPAHWQAADAPTKPVSASLGITTYNRVESCLGVLRQLGEDPDLLALVDRVYLVDQGEDRVGAADGFAAAAAGLGERLTVIEQPNLGGSGGFARCQLETLRAGQSDHLVILDDDVVLETEAVRRAVEFAARCTTPTLVGAHMFSLPEPTRLHAMAECVDTRRFRWGPKHEDQREHDLAVTGLRGTWWMHRREDVNYNGWWMCLIPRTVLETVGLSLPFFIRWDDAEFGLRAGAAGFPTVTLPGVAVWHVPWTHKTDALDWQAYFHQRNRIISALLHSPHGHGGMLVPDLLAHQVKHLASMQYSTAELRLLAISDVLAGPETLHTDLATKPEQARRLRAGFTDADVRSGAGDFPTAAQRSPRGAGRRRTPWWLGAGAGVARQVLPTREHSRRTPQVHLGAAEAHWSRLLKYDSAVVSTADGSGAVWYRRDRTMFADLARRSLALHRRLHREWPRLAARYGEALPGIASPSAWEGTFDSVRRRA
jgi:galactofuranosylgalactofuranosylrhamnosyl-N-acetylglucosaminyl-diphospho-decaprenol beta-1,5/1,6-galactofuranosyltransferase